MEVVEEPHRSAVESHRGVKSPPPTLPKSVAVLRALQEARILQGKVKPVDQHRTKPPVPKHKPVLKFPLKPRPKKKPPMSSQPPVPKPRKRGPPPKPAPYRQHLVNKSNEVTTFKSNMPTTQARSLSPLDATGVYATIEEKAQNRKSLKGEPSETFYSPVNSSPEPVACVVPTFPIDRRPRLNTPHTNDSEVLPRKTNEASKLSSTPEGEESPSAQALPPSSPVHVDAAAAEAHSRLDALSIPPPGPHDQASFTIGSRPRLKTPQVPPDPGKILRPPPKLPTPQTRARRRPPPKPGRKDSDTAVKDQEEKESSSAAVEPLNTKAPEGDESHVYAVVDVETKRSIVEGKKKEVSSLSPQSPTEQQHDTPSESKEEDTQVNDIRDPLAVDDLPNSDAAYDVTTHVISGKSLPSDLPLATPTLPVEEYNVTSHNHTVSGAGILNDNGEEYSKLPTSPEAAKTTPTLPAGDGYNVISHGTNQKVIGGGGVVQSKGEEYSKLPTSPVDSEPVEGYSLLGAVEKSDQSEGQGKVPLPAATSVPIQDAEYAEVREPSQPLRPPRPGRRARQADGSPVHQSSSSSGNNVADKRPKSRPMKPPRSNILSSSPPAVARNVGAPPSVSPKPHRRLPPTPNASPKLATGPKPSERPPNVGIPSKPKPPPAATKPNISNSPRRKHRAQPKDILQYENAPDHGKDMPPSNSGGVAVSPLVEVDVDKLRAVAFGKADGMSDSVEDLYVGESQQVGGAKRQSYENQEVTVDTLHDAELNKRRSYENQNVVATTPALQTEGTSMGSSHENQETVTAISVPPGTPPPDKEDGIGKASYGSPLSLSEVFIVPQHAVPGPLNYCEIDVNNTSSSSLVTPPHSAKVSESGDQAVVPSSNVYPNAQGYFDIAIRDETERSQGNEVISSTDDRKNSEEEQRVEIEQPEVEDGGVVESAESNGLQPSTNLALDESGGLANGLLRNDQVSSPPMSETTPISTASASLVTSSESIIVQADEGVTSEGGRGNQRAKAIGGMECDGQKYLEDSGSPRTKRPSGSGLKVKGGKQYGPRRALSAKRRPPPPPPPPSTPRPALPLDATATGAAKDSDALRTGLCTLPRANRTGGGAPPRSNRPPPPPVPYNAQKKKGDAPSKPRPPQQPPPPPPPGSLPPSQPVPPSSPPSILSTPQNVSYLGPPQGLVSSSELSSQPGLKKKLIGFFKMSNPPEESQQQQQQQDFTRQSSLRRSKKKSKGKSDVDVKDRGRAESLTKTLPRNMGSKLRSNTGGGGGPTQNVGSSLAAEDSRVPQEDLEFGIYSTIPDTRKGSAPSTPVTVKSAKDVHSVEKKGVNAIVAYDLIQSEGGIVESRGGGALNERLARSSSAEHLYEATPIGAGNKKKNMPSGTKSSNNSPHIVRRFSEDQVGGDLDDVFGDGLYAQVLDSKKLKKQKDKKQSAESVGGDSEAAVKGAGSEQGSERSEGGENTENCRIHNGQTLVVTYHELPAELKGKTEEPVSSANIEHTVTGDATYAVVQTVKKKKKKKKTEDKDEGEGAKDGLEHGDEGTSEPSTPNVESGEVFVAGESGQEVVENGDLRGGEKVSENGQATSGRDESMDEVGKNVEVVDMLKEECKEEKLEKSRVESVATERKGRATPPPKPRRSMKGNPRNKANSDSPEPAVVAGTSPTVTTAISGGRGARVRKSPARQAPPPPPGRAKSPPAPPAPTGQAPPSIPPPPPPSDPQPSGPPAFPPPPPPFDSKSPSPVPVDAEEPTYAVVSMKPAKVKKVDPNSIIDDWLAEDIAQETKTEEAVKKDISENIPVKSTKKHSLANGKTSNSVSSSPTTNEKSSSLKRGLNLRSSFKRDKMKKNPSLPPKHNPPPPPPPTGSVAPPISKDAGGVRRGSVGNGTHTFLFSSDYASTLIKVGEDQSADMNGDQEDSDAEPCYSTEWETSSDEEGEGDREDREAKEKMPSTPRSKTFYIAQEILTTERTYVKGLRLLDNDFRKAVRSANNAHEKPVISDENMKVIMGNVGSILTLNSGLLEELEARMAIWDKKPLIGDILVSRAPYFKIYTEYISRFDNALKMLDEQKKNPVFAAVLQEFESQPKCANIPLAGYMLDVVQRITRYKLLFADYVKHLPEDSEDRMPSERALSIVSDAATHVNETIRQMDNFRKVMEVRKKLVGDYGDMLITPSRQLLKEGELVKCSRKEKQPRMFFLFSDILIYASVIPPTNNTYKVIKRIPLEGMKVDFIEDPEMRHAFQIISTCKSFRLEASNEKERKSWVEIFDKAIKELSEKSLIKLLSRKSQVFTDPDGVDSDAPLGSLAPPWLPDSSVSMCQLCSYNFTMTRRRHHCRACGMIFCGDCSGYYAPLKYKNNKISRVCQSCYEKLSESDSPTKRVKGTLKSHKQVSMPSVLREVRARDQNAQISGYLQTSSSKAKRWKKRWFVVYNLVLYEFERHEDVSAKRSVTLPSYQVTLRQNDPLVLCLRHPGTGKEYLKAESEEQSQRWMEVLKKAAAGELDITCSTESFHETSTSSLSSSLSHSASAPGHHPPCPTSQLSVRSEEDGDADQEDSFDEDEEGGDTKENPLSSDGSFSNC